MHKTKLTILYPILTWENIREVEGSSPFALTLFLMPQQGTHLIPGTERNP